MADRVPTPASSAQQAPADARIVMYSTSWCSDCRRAKRVFATLAVPYFEIDIEKHPEAAQTVMRVNRGARSVPTIIFPDGSSLTEPSSSALEAKLRAL